MKMRFVCLAVAVLLPVTGSCAKPQTDQPTVSSIVPTFTPAKTSDPAETPAPTPMASPTPQNLVQARPTPPQVIPYQTLIAFLPTPPWGWTAEKPTGSTDQIEVFNLSTVSQTYQRGDDENAPVVTVTIIDAGGHKGYFETTTGPWKRNSETPEGYDRGVDIDGMPGYEHYSKAAKSSSLSVVVGKRYFIQIEVTNLHPAELRVWLGKIDIKKLAELK